MIIQEYPIVERAVYQGVAIAISTVLNQTKEKLSPENIVANIVAHIMAELTDVIDFGSHAIRLNPALVQAIMEKNTEEQPEPEPPAQNEQP